MGQRTILILLDVTAAFDTVDHTILLKTLNHVHHFGVSGKALAWFTSYLQHRQQAVQVPGATSEMQELAFGVPQGSVLGLILHVHCVHQASE